MKKGGMEGGPGEQATRGTRRGLEGEVRIPPHETEGSWSIGERLGKTARGAATKAKKATKKGATKKSAATARGKTRTKRR